MKNLILILCFLTFTGTAFAEVDYNRTSSPLSVGETDKYFKDLNSWDSRNLYVPGQPYNKQYDYSYIDDYTPSRANGTYTTTSGETVVNSNQGANVNASETTVVKRRRNGWRWGKSPNETHYNFGGTGFKSKGFGQGYTN